jgi:hypothetical protein
VVAIRAISNIPRNLNVKNRADRAIVNIVLTVLISRETVSQQGFLSVFSYGYHGDPPML